jgi:hypothetical protein
MSAKRHESSSPCNGAPQGGPARRYERRNNTAEGREGAATGLRKTTTKGETEGHGNRAAEDDGDARERARWGQQVDAMAD